MDSALKCVSPAAISTWNSRRVLAAILTRKSCATAKSKITFRTSSRASESLDAARVMGLEARLNLELPDGQVSVNDEARSAMVRVLRAHRPRVLFTSHWNDPHPDHAATCRIVREAARLATMKRYDEAAGADAIKMPAIAHAVYSRLILPSFIVDVSEFAEQKMEAIHAHASQFYSPESKEPATR